MAVQTALNLSICVAVTASAFCTLIETGSCQEIGHQSGLNYANERLAESQAYFESLDSASFQLDFVSERPVDGRTLRKRWRTAVVKFQLPNRLLIKTDAMKFSCDGAVTRFTATSVSGKPKFMESTGPKDLQEIVDDPCFRLITRHAAPLLSTILNAPGGLQSLIANSSQLESDGNANRLSFSDAAMERVLVFSNNPPMPTSFTISPTTEPPVGILPQVQTVEVSNWQKNPSFNEAEFQIQVPPDSTKMASTRELFDIKRSAAPDSFVGKNAPKFEAIAIDSKDFDIAKHLGKHVIVLNFWTSWSGTFRRTVPIYERIHDEFDKRNVIFIGMNVGEEPAVVNYFVSETKPKLGRIVLDMDGSTAQLYGVTGFPRSCIIDKTGTIRAVFRGFSSNLEMRMKSAIEEALKTE
ncbi:MAG: TlpA family protein disulfide reductase [Planctomycetales bacterium]|nr:TlpA family protein disulfide reductase [Planctomycetales bacterium]